MLFNSFEFFIFFVVVTTLYYLLPHGYRWLLLLLASCFFYMFFIPIYFLILLFTIIIDYIAGIYIEDASGSKRKALLVMSLVANIGVLAIFKYVNFIIENLNILLHFWGIQEQIAQSLFHSTSIPILNIILPIGLSFHTFQAMSYTIEVFRGNQKAERHFGIYALYVMFYPQLVAGPIERPQNVLHQFHEKHTLDYNEFLIGMNQIMYGLFKKVVVADRLAVYVNAVYGDVAHASSLSILTAIIFFSFQIYCDFSGYSEIALGTARVMGFKLMTNFNRPYSAESIAEFWGKWHISLSSWFKDYLYIPLGGNRVSTMRRYFNLFTVFMVSGLWHGASWTFIVWGALHGVYQIFGMITKDIRSKIMQFIGISQAPFLQKSINILTTFSLVSFAWIFFRAKDFGHASAIINKLVEADFAFQGAQFFAGKGPFNFFLSIFAIFLLFISYYLPKNLQIKHNLAFVISLTIIIILIGKGSNEQFIYFQF